MRGIHPLYAAIGAVLCVVLAMFIAPVFPVPLSTILYWAGWVGALIFVVLGVAWLIPAGRRP
jgi:putative Mn2+ efflux pump MntP